MYYIMVLVVARQAINIIIAVKMITIAASQLQFYQKKIYRLEMDLIVLQQEAVAAHSKAAGDEHKIKYEMLLDKIAQENHLRESKKTIQSVQYEKIIVDLNQKWQCNLQEKTKQLRDQIDLLNSQKSILKSKLVDVEMKGLRLQREIDSGDSQVLNIKLVGLKKENDRLRIEANEAYQHCDKQMVDLKRNFEIRMQQTKEREKSFYREQIQSLERAVEELGVSLDRERERNNPERELLIDKLTQEIIGLKGEHDQQLHEMAVLLESKTKQYASAKQQTDLRQARHRQEITQLNQHLKQLEDRLFQNGFQKDRELQQLHGDMSSKRQNEANELKTELQRVAEQFSHEREEWRTIIARYEDETKRVKAVWEQEKNKYFEEKSRLKQKITQLKARLHEKEESVGKGETQLLIKSMREMNNSEGQFVSYENSITFMDRQVKKAIIKLEEKDREINNLLEELSSLQKETEREIQYTKQKSRGELKRLYDRVFVLEEQIDKLQQQLRERQKSIRKKEKDLSEEKEGRLIEISSLNKIIQEMQRDYQRLTGHKKKVQDCYRTEREVVITAKIDVNQEKKKKLTQLEKQKDNMELLYREKEQQLKAEAEVIIDRLKRDKNGLTLEKEQLKAEVESLKQRLNITASENKENKYVQFQKKMATLDLEISLTQNLFKTLASATSRQQSQHRKTELDEVSEGQSERISSQQSFQKKRMEEFSPKLQTSEIYKAGGAFSFFPSQEYRK